MMKWGAPVVANKWRIEEEEDDDDFRIVSCYSASPPLLDVGGTLCDDDDFGDDDEDDDDDGDGDGDEHPLVYPKSFMKI